jgi:hypothetical protein
MKLGIVVIAGLLAIVGVQSVPQAQNAEDKAHQQWLLERYKEAISIRSGMTRADLHKLFSQDGGFVVPDAQRYHLKSCSLIHITVKFDKYDFANRQRDDSVRIVEVSTPTLEPVTLD